MRSSLLFDLADVFAREADGIKQPYAWPPRQPLTDEERREVDRLVVTSRRIAYRGGCAAYEESPCPPR